MKFDEASESGAPQPLERFSQSGDVRGTSHVNGHGHSTDGNGKSRTQFVSQRQKPCDAGRPPLQLLQWLDRSRMRTCPILVSVTKAQLAEQLAPALELSKEKAEKTVEAVFAAIVKALKDGEKLDIRGFGNFKVKDQPARQARNPRTGEAIAVAAKKVAVFKPGKEMAEALNPAAEAQSGASTLGLVPVNTSLL